MISAPPIARRSVILGGLSLGAAAGLPLPALSQGAADLVLINGRITTLDPIRPEVSAVAVRNGIVFATGSDGDVRNAVPGALEADLGGRRVIPGLNDSHLHATRGARLYNLELRWDGLRSLARGIDMIRQQAARTPAG